MKALKPEQAKKIKTTALAAKHGVSPRYVGMILVGKRDAKSKRAMAILKDAHKLIKLLEF